MSATSTQTPQSSSKIPISSMIQKLISDLQKSGGPAIKKRRIFFFCLFILIWSFFALILHPFQTSIWDEIYRNRIDLSEVIAAIPYWYFSLDVLIHLFLVIVGAILSYQIISHYFLTIYGFKTRNHSDHFLLRIIFGFPKEEPIKIDVNSLLDKEKEYLKTIGGPAKVIIGAESAVIFENSDNSIQIVGPSMNLPGSYYQLDNFEHLREIIDLRNQTIQFDVQARTKDGIPLTISKVHVLYSILRGSKKTTLTRPYPFSAQGLYSLVYKMPSGILVEKISELVKQEFINFIRQYSLAEILENIGEPEIQRKANLVAFEQAIKYHKRQKFGFSTQKHNYFQHLNNKNMFRKKIGRDHKKLYPLLLRKNEASRTNLQPEFSANKDFSSKLLRELKLDFTAHTLQYGIQIIWISLGAIECPSEKIQSHLRRVWQLSLENQMTSSQMEYKKNKTESEKNEIASIFNDIFGSEKGDYDIETNGQQNQKIILRIHNFLIACQTLYENEPLNKRKQLDHAIHELDLFLDNERK